mmetsp:Transcript_50751/g.128887  ORF Transcript_50751/g.128887 Transcript_50751/m.128887 type:complete len:598 (-) Transcript_50751:185-1978(-)
MAMAVPASTLLLPLLLATLAGTPFVAAESDGQALVLRSGSPLQRIAAALRGAVTEEPRRLQGGCRATAMRLMPPPALKHYQQCFQDKLSENSTHDWSVPGAELDAQVDCWCQHNLTHTIEEFQCCDHADLYPMCTVNCEPDCNSDLAKTCIQECPSMCFESSEYIVSEGLCKSCDWIKCWPALKCLTKYAQLRIENGTVNKTCHERRFTNGAQLGKYWQCWKDAPKHSSHWAVLSSVVHCVCREGMIEHTRNQSCCDSVLYGGGVCDLQCMSEAVCSTQEAQTCIYMCQSRCTSYEMAPSKDCMSYCLEKNAPCRKFATCGPPMLAGHVCGDGRWPEASSGCCSMNQTNGRPGQILGCPRLCDTQRIWRLDGSRSIPWWSRWQPGPGIVAQCTCKGCPTSSSEAILKLDLTVTDGIWDNGQMMLVDIARRQGLLHGPNRRMQELMVMRNDKILEVLKGKEQPDRANSFLIAQINDEYTQLISEAAKSFGDDGYMLTHNDAELEAAAKKETKNSIVYFVVTAGGCTIAIVAAIACATRVITRRRKANAIIQFGNTDEVVIGNPVGEGATMVSGTPVTGAPVTVSAPTKGSQDTPKDLS